MATVEIILAQPQRLKCMLPPYLHSEDRKKINAAPRLAVWKTPAFNVPPIASWYFSFLRCIFVFKILYMIYTKTHNKAQSLQITWCRAPQKNPQIGESVTTELQTGRGPLLEKKKWQEILKPGHYFIVNIWQTYITWQKQAYKITQRCFILVSK